METSSIILIVLSLIAIAILTVNYLNLKNSKLILEHEKIKKEKNEIFKDQNERLISKLDEFLENNKVNHQSVVVLLEKINLCMTSENEKLISNYSDSNIQFKEFLKRIHECVDLGNELIKRTHQEILVKWQSLIEQNSTNRKLLESLLHEYKSGTTLNSNNLERLLEKTDKINSTLLEVVELENELKSN